MKRARSESDASDGSRAWDQETEDTVTRMAKSSFYDNTWYLTLMEQKGSYMHDSPEGPMQEDVDLCHRLLTEAAPLPDDPLWEPQNVPRIESLLRSRSKLHVCIELHPRLVPSSEKLRLQNPGLFSDLEEGHDDRWLDAQKFCEKLPQPERTKAYSFSAFTEDERCKLGWDPYRASWFTIHYRLLFPYFTCEVGEGLYVPERANLNNMTIALRNVVELYRRAGIPMMVHRRILGFSISHDYGFVYICAHYPHIDGSKTTYWQRTIQAFSYSTDDAKDRWTAYQFVYNVDTIFAPAHLKRLKEAINRLPDPLSISKSDAAFIEPKPSPRMTNANLAQQLEQQRKDFMEQTADEQTAEESITEESTTEEHNQRMEQMAEDLRQWMEQNAEKHRQLMERTKRMAEEHRQWMEQNAEKHRQLMERTKRMAEEHRQNMERMAEEHRQNMEQMAEGAQQEYGGD